MMMKVRPAPCRLERYHQLSRRALTHYGIKGFPDCPYANQLARAGEVAIGRVDVRLRHDAAGESHLRRFADAQRRLCGAADFAG